MSKFQLIKVFHVYIPRKYCDSLYVSGMVECNNLVATFKNTVAASYFQKKKKLDALGLMTMWFFLIH